MKKLEFAILIILIIIVSACDDKEKSATDSDITADSDIMQDEDVDFTDEDVDFDEDMFPDEENDQDVDEILFNQTGGFFLFTTKEDGSTPQSHFVTGEGGFFGISFSSMSGTDKFAVGAHYAAVEPFDLENGTGKVYIFDRETIPETYKDAASVLMHPQKSLFAGFGYTISDRLCDINGDGIEDFAISSHLDSISGSSSCGSIIIFYGESENNFSNENQVRQLYISDTLRGDRDAMGQSLTCFDYNDDGYSDIFAGGQNAGADLNPGSTGMVAVFDGSEDSETANETFTIVPELQESQQYFGSSIIAYDFNDDGKKDIAIGGWGLKEDENDVNRGAVFIYDGAESFDGADPVAKIFPDSLEKITFASSIKIIDTGTGKYLAASSKKGVHIFPFDKSFPESSTETLLTFEESEISDFDYIPDLYGKDKGAIVAGYKYGGDGGIAFSFKYDSETGTFEEGELFLPEIVTSGDGFGSSIKNLGDIDGDGLSDFVIGTPEHLEYL